MSSKRSQARLVLALVLVTATVARPESQPPPAPAPLPGPSITEALKALEVARAAATRIGVKVSCAVVDSRGDLIALTRMDGAQFFVADIARGKAQLSAMFGQPSADLVRFGASSSFSNLNAVAQGRLYPMPGAVPISRSNQVIGAIGCSGATGEQDIEAAKAGLAAF
jgi:glc operon protein GlcG